MCSSDLRTRLHVTVRTDHVPVKAERALRVSDGERNVVEGRHSSHCRRCRESNLTSPQPSRDVWRRILGTLPGMTDDKPKAEQAEAAGREVFVTKDESGITSLAEEEDAADPRVVPEESTDDDGDAESSAEASDSD